MATFEPLEEGDVLTELGGKPIFKRRSYGSSSTSCSSSAPSPETEEFELLESAFTMNYLKNCMSKEYPIVIRTYHGNCLRSRCGRESCQDCLGSCR